MLKIRQISFIKIECKSSISVISIGIKYSVCDLICDVNMLAATNGSGSVSHGDSLENIYWRLELKVVS